MEKHKNRELSNEEANKKIKDLKLELVRSIVNASKTGSSKIKKTRREIARTITLNKSQKEKLRNKN